MFYDEDLRFDYMQAFKQLTKCLHLVFPAREALEFMNDYNALSEINILAGKHFRDGRLSMIGIPPKLRAITDKYLESRSIDQKVKPISILDVAQGGSAVAPVAHPRAGRHGAGLGEAGGWRKGPRRALGEHARRFSGWCSRTTGARKFEIRTR